MQSPTASQMSQTFSKALKQQPPHLDHSAKQAPGAWKQLTNPEQRHKEIYRKASKHTSAGQLPQASTNPHLHTTSHTLSSSLSRMDMFLLGSRCRSAAPLRRFLPPLPLFFGMLNAGWCKPGVRCCLCCSR